MNQHDTPAKVASTDGLGAFFTAVQLQAATMSELASLRAERGYCPKCQAQKLRHVSSGGGLVFRQCAACGTVAVLGA
jgi:hypothetical protein